MLMLNNCMHTILDLRSMAELNTQFFFIQLVPIVIDVSLLGGAKAKPSQGTNVCVLKCFYQEVSN